MERPILSYTSHNVYSGVSALRNDCLPWHNLIILLEGQMTYVLEGIPTVLSAGTVLFLPEKSKRIRMATEQNVNFFVFNFVIDTPIALPTLLHDAIHGEVFSLLAAYDAINKIPTPKNREKNEHLLACLLSVLEEFAAAQAYSRLTHTVLDDLHRRFREKITLREIGEKTFFSPIYCDTVFKRDIGCGIIDYVLTLRTEEAKRLLVEEDTDIRTIAKTVGFGDSNYFSRVFKKRVGCSPSAYRQRMLS